MKPAWGEEDVFCFQAEPHTEGDKLLLLENKIKGRAGEINPLNYYLRNVGI